MLHQVVIPPTESNKYCPRPFLNLANPLILRILTLTVWDYLFFPFWKRSNIYLGNYIINLMKRLISFLSLVLLGVVFSHASVVIVTLTITPRSPEANQNFQIELYLEDPLQTPVEDAIILVEASMQEVDSVPIIANLTENSAGTYQTNIKLPQEGTWELFFRDKTFKQEEATALTSITVGTENPKRIEFIFPPTQISSNNLWVWLIWVIGLPIVAALIVTVLVLSSGKAENSKSKSR